MTEHKKQKRNSLIQTIKFNQIIQFKLNQNALNKNFQIIAQSLSQINHVTNLAQDHQTQISAIKAKFNKQQREITQIFKILEARKPQADVNDLLNRMQIQEKTIKQLKKQQLQHSKNIQKLFDVAKFLDYNQLVRNIKNLNEFSNKKEVDTFMQETKNRLINLDQNVVRKEKLQNQLKMYVLQSNYTHFIEQTKIQLLKLQNQKTNYHQTQKLEEVIKNESIKMEEIMKKNQIFSNRIEQLNQILKNLDLSGMQNRIKKIKEDFIFQIGGIRSVMNSKISFNQFQSFNKNVFSKLDSLNFQISQNLADKHQTKRALIFLQRRINHLMIKSSTKNSGQNKPDDGLEGILTISNPIHCATCSTVLTKFDSKSKYNPWSNFPTRQHQHGGKDKNFENFVQKLAIKKLSQPFLIKTNAEQKLQLLADAINNLKQGGQIQDPMTNRMTNYMQSYGQLTKRGPTGLSQGKQRQKKFQIRKSSSHQKVRLQKQQKNI